MMHIAIIGTGNIGGNLGRVWASKGHTITFGAREPLSGKTKAALSVLTELGQEARILPPADAAAEAEVVVLAVPGSAVRDVASTLGDLSGKIIIDTTNLVGAPVGDANSLAESIAQRLPGARVVKAFNTVGAEMLLDPRIGMEAQTTFICGDDLTAKQVVMQLAADIGLDSVDAGPLASAASIEQLVVLWLTLARQYGRTIGFRLLRR